MNTDRAIELLNCAEVNCDNIKKVGVVFADIVKAQIQEAIVELEGEIFTEDALASVR